MFQSKDTSEFRRSLGLSASEDDMHKFQDILAALRDIIHEHLDVTVTWLEQPQDARDALHKAVSPSHVVLFIYLLIIIVQCKERVPDVKRNNESISGCQIYIKKMFYHYRAKAKKNRNKGSSVSKVRCWLGHIHITLLYLSVSKEQVMGQPEGSEGLEKGTGTDSTPCMTFW